MKLLMSFLKLDINWVKHYNNSPLPKSILSSLKISICREKKDADVHTQEVAI